MDRLNKAISDVAFTLDNLILLRQIQSTGDCNVCRNKGNGCLYEPKPGQMVRYNCPFFKTERKERNNMADIELVIKIDEETLQDLYDNRYVSSHIKEALRNGTPLPKGHGDIVDIEHLIDMFWDGNSMEITKYDLSVIEPIIEADRESEEE